MWLVSDMKKYITFVIFILFFLLPSFAYLGGNLEEMLRRSYARYDPDVNEFLGLKDEPKYYGYIIELKAPPLAVYETGVKKELKELEKKYDSLSPREKNSIAGMVLYGNIKAKKKYIKNILSTYGKEIERQHKRLKELLFCLLYTSPSPRD